MRYLQALVLMLAILSAVPGADKPLLKKTPVDKAVDRALAFLANTQLDLEGAWTAGRSGRNVAITSLAVMAFLSAGHVPGEGRYGAVVEKGVRWVLARQQPNGLLANDAGHEMYHHGIATLMLAEVSGLVTGDLAKETRRAVEKAVAVILKAQRVRDQYKGGWRYTIAHTDGSDVSVTGWQVMALRAARNLGCDVPGEAIEQAVEYLKRCHDPRSGGFRYMPYTYVTTGCTGAAVLSLELCGKKEHRSDMVLKGADYLIRRDNLPRWGVWHFSYNIYYGSQATFQVGGNYWTAYRTQLHRTLLINQGETGSWLNTQDAQFGPNYCTAMAVLALTVEYRFLPIYQRGEEPSEKGD
ncbi:MAG: prenyltransferase [Planctomycetia bacterium]|nr:prenyltransferase [Planctomycetia bacterium]